MSAPKKPVGVAAIAALKDGKLLMGKRRDDEKWCCPGGHIEPGEDPTAAAHRELEEETGLTAVGMMRPLDRKAVKDGEIHVHAFQADVDGEPSNEADPDAEFSEFRWVDPDAMPADVMRNLHNNPDVVLDALDARGSPWASFNAEAA